jgi:molybdopterin/thiamine biosynthesis adenylyltransferase/proteasome lid subunit RPN8/RPN11
MSRVTLVLPETIFDELTKVVGENLETAGVLLAQPLRADDGSLRLLATRIRWCPEEAYTERHERGLSITSDGYIPALAEAEKSGEVAVWLHTHPGDGSSPRASHLDRKVDSQLSDLFRLRTGSEYYGSLVVSMASAQLRFTGRLESEHDEYDIDRLWAVGDRFRLIHHDDHDLGRADQTFDRNIRAFGGPIQSVLSDLTVAIVGCGGTGSSVGEQLARLGVKHFILIDPAKISPSNVTRVYGSSPERIGDRKVEVLANLITSIVPDAEVMCEDSLVTVEATAHRLTAADLVFGCTDDNAGRMVLSRTASYLLTPVIDCGVLLTSGANGVLDGINGRVTILSPGSACLVCRGRIDQSRAASELLTPEERMRRTDEGYAMALPGIEPAVVTFTTAVGSAAVTELLERLAGYGPEPVPSEILLRLHDREISTNRQSPDDRHYCHPSAGKLGAANAKPYLEQMWTA